MIQLRRSKPGKTLQILRQLLTTAVVDNYIRPSMTGDPVDLEESSILRYTGLIQDDLSNCKTPFLFNDDGTLKFCEDMLVDLSELYPDDLVMLGFMQWDDEDDDMLWLAPAWLWPFIKPGSQVDTFGGDEEPITVPKDYQYDGKQTLDADRRFGALPWGIRESRLSQPPA